MNTWIDLPVVEAMEYFSGIIATAYKWANNYALLIGTIGLLWSGFKVMMSRMTVKDLWWDTLFKWCGFILLMQMYPFLTNGFASLGHEIAMKAGGGESVIVLGLKQLKTAVEADLKTQKEIAAGLESDLESKFNGLTLTVDFQNSKDLDDYLSKVSDEVAHKFSSKKDRENAKQLLDSYKEKQKYLVMYSSKTLKALDRVLTTKNIDGTEGDTLTNSYVQLDIYLKDAKGEKTPYISPSALLRVALFSCQIMFEKENIAYVKAVDKIDAREDEGLIDISKSWDKVGAFFSRIPQLIMCMFSCIVLIIATVFAEIQYVMTILEYTIIVGIGAIFIPLMLFDGTKDIPKKLVPVFMSFMVKILVITVCLMFVYYLMIENCINTIKDDGSMNWAAVGEIIFEAMLAYILTQNAPKIAQTILTGQPQLSMGEALQAGGTALATAGAMKAAAAGTARTAYNKGSDLTGGIKKTASAARSAADSLGSGATKGQKLKAAVGGAGAVASAELKERFKAGAEKFSKGHSSIPVLDKAMQMSGIKNSSGSGGAGGAGTGANAHLPTGQGKDGKAYSATSNPNFATATKTDSKTGQQRGMTHKEFNTEKMRQGVETGSQYGEKMRKKLDAKNAEKADRNNSGPLPENLTGGERQSGK